MKRNVLLWGLVPVLSSFYQLCLKLAMAHMPQIDFGADWLAHAAMSPWMWAALVSEAATFVLWMQILASHDLSKAFPLSAVSYVLILCTGWFVFNETILPLQLAGGALILAGVWLIGTATTYREAT